MRSTSGGPCNHCGRTITPCWRKGPPEKPVLCNACGARYLVKHTLDGYMPGQKQPTGREDKVEGPSRTSHYSLSSSHLGKRAYSESSRSDSDKEDCGSDFERADKVSTVSSSCQSLYFDCSGLGIEVSVATFDRASDGLKRSRHPKCGSELCFPLFQSAQDPGSLAATTLALLQASSEATLSQPLFQRRRRKQARPAACAI